MIIKKQFLIFSLILLAFASYSQDRIIVAFNEDEEPSEDWVDFMQSHIDTFKTFQIPLFYLQNGNDSLPFDYLKYNITKADLNNYILKYSWGYLLMETGKNIYFQSFEIPDLVRKQIKKYFEIE